jgi:hypothetical protein
MRLKKLLQLPTLVALTLISGVTALFSIRLRPTQLIDPDIFFHLALSRFASETGWIPRTLPQVVGLGWDQFFEEKEFFYHLLTTALWGVGGENAIRILSPILLFTTLVGLYFWARKEGLSTLWSLFSLLPMVLATHYMMRMQLVRAYTLAVPLALGLLVMLDRRKWKLAFAFTALYILSYHALQVPVLLLGAWGLSRLVSKEHDERSILSPGVFSVLGGLLVGILVNPYFPANFFFGLEILKIPMLVSEAGGTLNFGAELYPWRSDTWLRSGALSFFVLALGVILGLLRNVYFLSALGFFALSLISPRALEFAVPLISMLFAHVLLRAPRTDRRWSVGILGGTLALALYHGTQIFEMLKNPASHGGIEKLMEAARAFPSGSVTQKVFNCNWSETPYLFYARPDLSFIDLLDPSLLYQRDPTGHKLRHQLNEGLIPDVGGVLKDYFEADLIYCGNPILNERFEQDPRFERLYPKAGFREASPISAYRRVEGASKIQFLSAMEYFLVRLGEGQGPKRLKPEKSREFVPVSLPLQSQSQPVYFDFVKQAGLKVEDLRVGGGVCVFARPVQNVGFGEAHEPSSELFLALGGGPTFRVWSDGRSLFQSNTEVPLPLLTKTLIPIHAKDLRGLELLLCSSKDYGFLGVSVSIWTRKQVSDFCRSRGSDFVLDRTDVSEWDYWGNELRTCVGSIATSTKLWPKKTTRDQR